MDYNEYINIYNLEVENDHTFYVAEQKILVHNTYKMPKLNELYNAEINKLPTEKSKEAFKSVLDKIEGTKNTDLIHKFENELLELNISIGKGVK